MGEYNVSDMWRAAPQMTQEQMSWVVALVASLGSCVMQHGYEAIDDVRAVVDVSGVKYEEIQPHIDRAVANHVERMRSN